MTLDTIIKKLKSLKNPKNISGMARFGINPKNTLGISIPTLRQLSKKIGKNHDLAVKLWDTGIHEARILAGFIADPKKMTEGQMDKWVSEFDSWDVCDQVCSSLFDKTSFAWKKIKSWVADEREFVRRAGFVMMAVLAVHDKKAKDEDFLRLFPLIKKYAQDERNFVKKAVNWALRQIGKRNNNLADKAIKLGEEIFATQSKSAKWIASDAVRELKKCILVWK